MSKLEQAFVSTADNTFKKVTAKNGRTMHFKDGTPITQNAFNAGTQHMKYKGEKVGVAVPSDKGPGYERIEVSNPEASSLGQQLSLWAHDRENEAQDTVTLAGQTYETTELVGLNNEIVQQHGAEIVMKY